MKSIIGHELARQMLDRAAADNRVRHAYLLAGPASVGKAAVAHWLAMRLNCLNPSPPCGECRSCRLIESGSHPDVRALQLPADRDPALGLALDVTQRSTRTAERVISIEQVRALQHDASLAPHEGRWKVYLITSAESLGLEAANCLLKTLEEPPEHVVLILTVVDPSDLPATVLSRCQTVRLGLVPTSTIAAALAADYQCEPDLSNLLARLSGGRPGWAIEASSKPAVLEERTRALEDLELTFRPGFRDRLGLAERLAADYSHDHEKVLRILTLWQLYWWDVQLVQRGCADLLTNPDRENAVRALAEHVPASAVQDYVRELGTAAQRLLRNVNPRLALEALLVTSPFAPDAIVQ